ncbi:MAG: hypothetical protein R6T96_12115 [Longimicrobiales bacterium]
MMEEILHGALRSSLRQLSLAALLAAPLALGGCDDPGKGDVADIEAVGAVGARLIFDTNGNGRVDSGDRVLSGWTVNLEQPAGGLIASQVTDEEGEAIFEEVPVGRLVAGVPDEELGDTVSLLPSSVQPFILEAFQSVQLTSVVTLPSFTVQEVRALPSAKPLFTEGIALNRLVQGDMTLHIWSGSTYLRILSVEEATTFSPGDSVRVSGRTAVDNGVPVLDGQAVFRLVSSARAPTAVKLSTGEAAGARAGSLDAALVEVNSADVLEVLDQGNDGVLVRVDDGTGPLRVRFRSFFNLDPGSVDAETDSFGYAVGLLVPVRLENSVVWEIHPRTPSDVLIVRTIG